MIKVNNIKKIDLLYLGLFFIAHFFMLVNYEGLYWDDWVAYAQERETLAVLNDMLQTGIKNEFFTIMSNLFNSIYAFRLFVFFEQF